MASDYSAAGGQSLVVHQDAMDAACQAASLSVDHLIWHANAETARAVTLFGPGLVVLPALGKVSGVDGKRCLSYDAHPKRNSPGGLVDRVDLESKFGQLDPACLADELVGGKVRLESKIKGMSDEELRDEVLAFQEWKKRASGRQKTLERRVAWAFLGIDAGTACPDAVKKAFKRKALELHPDKGGDAERFRLLQEMKELLADAADKKNIDDEGKENSRKNKNRPDKDQKDKKERKQDEVDSDLDEEFSSDDSWEADEELKKMFPKRNKNRKRPNGEDDGTSLNPGENINRDQLIAARRKLHRGLVELWERSGRLVEEIRLNQPAGNASEALRQLRCFVDRFASMEVSRLKEKDPRKAERIFRRFLEQGSEVVCAAGLVDPVSTASYIALQVNWPLLTTAHSESLQASCAALVDAIQSLPTTFDSYVAPVQEEFNQRLAQESSAQEVASLNPTLVRVIFPGAVPAPPTGTDQKIPSIQEERIELLPRATMGDLRVACIRLNGGGSFAPRLFCNGEFLLGHDTKPLASIEAIREGCPVHCLPSNRDAARQTANNAGAAAEAVSLAPKGSESPGPNSEKVSAQQPVHAAPGNCQVSQELLEALDLAEKKAAMVVAETEEIPEVSPAAVPGDTKPGQARQPESADDDWFDDFFATTAEPTVTSRAAASKQEDEKRKQTRANFSLDARLAAQKRAAEARTRPRSVNGAVSGAKDQEFLALVPQKDHAELGKLRVRTAWDDGWSHQCAGERLADGSAIYCHACETLVFCAEPFDHRCFELHCENVGHYGWID